MGGDTALRRQIPEYHNIVPRKWLELRSKAAEGSFAGELCVACGHSKMQELASNAILRSDDADACGRCRPFQRKRRVMTESSIRRCLFVLAVVAGTISPKALSANANPEEVIMEIQQLGGRVTRSANIPDSPVTIVDLYGTKATDALLNRLACFSQLETLKLTDAPVTDAGLKYLKGMTNLQELVLFGTKITDAGLEYLKGMKHLRRLDLCKTKVSNAGLQNITGLIQLQDLDLSSTKVTDAGLRHLKGMTQLQKLGLAFDSVTDAGLKNLEGLTQLHDLELGIMARSKEIATLVLT